MTYNFSNKPLHLANQQSSFGLSPNAAALVSYIWMPVTGIAVLVTEKQNRLVRFHAYQSLLFGLGVVAGTLALSAVIGVLMLVAGAISPYAGILVSIASLLVWLVITVALLVIWVRCLIKAYRGEMYKLPVVGKHAERMANK